MKAWLCLELKNAAGGRGGEGRVKMGVLAVQSCNQHVQSQHNKILLTACF